MKSWIEDVIGLNHLKHQGKLGKYQWVYSRSDPNPVCYLRLIQPDNVISSTIAKVYLWEGEIMHSVKVNLTEHPDYDYIVKTIDIEKEFLRRDVANRIANRMEN